MKKQKSLAFGLMIVFLLTFSLNVYSALAWNECEVLKKAPDLNVECHDNTVFVFGEEIKSLEILSYPQDIEKKYLEDFSQKKVQENIFNNQTFGEKNITYNGVYFWQHEGEYELLVNGKYLKINVYMEDSCPNASQPNPFLMTIGIILAIIGAIVLLMSFIKRIKLHKKIKLTLMVSGTILLVLGIGALILAFIYIMPICY